MGPLVRSSHLERARRACEVLRTGQDRSGGWGLTLRQAPSLVNTAEALYVFAKAEVPLSETTLAGIRYLCQNVQLHTRLRQNGGRGENIRFLAFTLSGLADYEGVWPETEVAETVQWSIDWLARAKTRDGWPEVLGMHDSSLNQTAGVVMAVSSVYQRMRSFYPFYSNQSVVPDAMDLIVHGVHGLLKHRRVDLLWPPATFQTGGASPSKTSLAIMALRAASDALSLAGRTTEADQLRRKCEESAIRLAKIHSRWETYTEGDPDVPGTVWQHPAYSLGLAAVCIGGVDPHSRALDQAWRYLDRRWSPSSGSWLEPDGSLTVRMAFHAMRAYDSLWRASAHASPPIPLQVDLMLVVKSAERSRVTLEVGGQNAEVKLSPRMGELFEILYSSKSGLTSSAVAESLSLRQSSVAQYVARLNRIFHSQSSELIQEIVIFDAESQTYRLTSG